MEKCLPQKHDAECGVLGSILIDSEALTQVADFLLPEDFYRDAHKEIYRAMLHLFERREPADFLVLCNYLEQHNKLADVGGASYITSLINQVPTSSHAEYYGRLVARAAEHRRLIHAAGKIATCAYEERDDALSQAEELIYGIEHRQRGSDVVSVGSVFGESFGQFLEDGLQSGSIVGIPSGFSQLDEMTGGFQKSDLIILAGRPAMGKTSMMMSIARNAAMQYNFGVLCFSLEMSKEQLTQRLTAMEARVNLKKLRMRQLDTDEQARVIAVSGSILDASIWIDDTPAISLAAMRSKIRRTMAQQTIDLVVVDYLQKMQATIDGKRIAKRFEEVSEVARGLKDIAREFNVPVLALAQLNREVEARASKVPQLSDLRDSGEIEQEADIVMFIHRDDYYAGHNADGTSKSNRPGTADIVFAKHRNGETGEILLGFEPSQTRFFNRDELGRELAQ